MQRARAGAAEPQQPQVLQPCYGPQHCCIHVLAVAHIQRRQLQAINMRNRCQRMQSRVSEMLAPAQDMASEGEAMAAQEGCAATCAAYCCCQGGLLSDAVQLQNKQ